MPLFRRADAHPVKDTPADRQRWLHTSPSRNGSAVLFEDTLDLSRARRWLRGFNLARPSAIPAQPLHLFAWAAAQALWKRPALNRFVLGRRLYQRRGVFISVLTRGPAEDGVPSWLKLPFPQEEPFASSVDRLNAALSHGRSDVPGIGGHPDRLSTFLRRIPSFCLGAMTSWLRFCDRNALLPDAYVQGDPLHTSLLLTDTGALGFDRVFHPLFEVGGCSLVAALGGTRDAAPDRRNGARDVLETRWTVDQRIADPASYAIALKLIRRVLEEPEAVLGAPEPSARGQLARITASQPTLRREMN